MSMTSFKGISLDRWIIWIIGICARVLWLWWLVVSLLFLVVVVVVVAVAVVESCNNGKFFRCFGSTPMFRAGRIDDSVFLERR